MQSRRAVRYRIAAPSRHLVWASPAQGASATARLSRSHSSKVRCQFHTKCKEASSPVRRLASLRDRQSVALFEFQRGVEAAEAATENDYARLAGQTVNSLLSSLERAVQLPQQRPEHRRRNHRDQNRSTNNRCPAGRGVSAVWIYARV